MEYNVSQPKKWNDITVKSPYMLACILCVILPALGAEQQDELVFDNAPQQGKLVFDVVDYGDVNSSASQIDPWKVVVLDPRYSGRWVVTGDVDNDGNAEIVSSRIVFDDLDKNYLNWYSYTSTVVVQKLDGTVLWKWGDPNVGQRMWYGDVACQIYDWDGDGNNEIVIATKDHCIAFDGKTGLIKKNFPIPHGAANGLIFCNLSGKARATDVIFKTQYTHLWAYDESGKSLWDVNMPGGCRTAHEVCPIDLDGDGKDEIIAGFAILNYDGSVRNVYSSPTIDVNRWKGHLDSCAVYNTGRNPKNWRFVITCCGANNIAMIDGFGKSLWELNGPHCHFESVQIGKLMADVPGKQLVVDMDHRPINDSIILVLDSNGVIKGKLKLVYGRSHMLLDWNNDGLEEIILPNARGVFDGHGRRIATFKCPAGKSVLPGDMNRDGCSDVTIVTEKAVYIFARESKTRSNSRVPQGCGKNFSLY